ncbi:MAG: hypothetical protein ACLQK8_12370 [Streptosporangiaceae bacterium]
MPLSYVHHGEARLVPAHQGSRGQRPSRSSWRQQRPEPRGRPVLPAGCGQHGGAALTAATADAALAERNPHWYGEVVAPVIAALLGQPGDPGQPGQPGQPGEAALPGPRRLTVQVPNGGLVPFLRPTAAVEVTAEIGPDGVRVLPVPEIPPELKVLTLQLTEADELTRAASLAGDPELAVRALA